jgi:hypothetical protein
VPTLTGKYFLTLPTSFVKRDYSLFFLRKSSRREYSGALGEVNNFFAKKKVVSIPIR